MPPDHTGSFSGRRRVCSPRTGTRGAMADRPSQLAAGAAIGRSMDARVKTDSMMAATQGRPEFSVVSPVRNEAENVETLVREEIERVSRRGR